MPNEKSTTLFKHKKHRLVYWTSFSQTTFFTCLGKPSPGLHLTLTDFDLLLVYRISKISLKIVIRIMLNCNIMNEN